MFNQLPGGHTLANRYRIETMIGRGGMADVYKATDVMLDRVVAVKVLTDRSDEVRRRFLKEAQAMARLSHPNVVGVYDVGESDGISFIVMELVVGKTLQDVKANELSFRKAALYVVGLLDALAYAHSLQIIHRDIKPANVMVLADEKIKVMDFGLSRRMNDMSHVTQAGEIVGTIAYLPPERFLGKAGDASGDLYSVGVMMYEMFTGGVPFKSETDDLVAVIFQHVNDPPVPPRQINPQIPPPLEAIIMKLLEKEPEKRYQKAEEVITALKQLLEPGAAPQPAPAPVAAPAGASTKGASGKAAAAASGKRAGDDIGLKLALDDALAKTRTLNDAFARVMEGMLAARRRDYVEGRKAFMVALTALKRMNNELEWSKTALKYASMVLQKSTEGQRPDREEVEEAIEALREAVPAFRGRQMSKELEEAERTLYALGRLGVGYG